MRHLSERLAAAPRCVSTRDLRQAGFSDRAIARRVTTGTLIRLRQGRFADGQAWERASADVRHLTAIVAAHRDAARAPVFSHRSAATLHDWPVWSHWLARVFGDASVREEGSLPAANCTVHVTHATRHGDARVSVTRHRAALATSDVQTHSGLVYTTPERTLLDLARTETFGLALVCTDVWLRRTCRRGHRVDVQAWHEWRAAVIDRARRAPRHPGTARLRALATLGDPRSDSVLETISRLRFAQLGIPVRLQRPVASESGSMYFLDFELIGLGVFGECDGKSKYTDPHLLQSRRPEEVVFAEKRRHDWISNTTGMRGIRWGAPEVETLPQFRSFLRASGVAVPERPAPHPDPSAARVLRDLPR